LSPARILTAIKPLSRFAWCIGGPIDFLITGLINASIPALVFWGDFVVGMWAFHSIWMVSGPMFFLLPLLTTISGVYGGAIQRK
jgi:hypothetical protein